MESFLVGVAVVIVCLLSFAVSLYNIVKLRVGYLQGMQIGCSYLLCGPMLVSLAFGDMPGFDLNIERFNILRDYDVTAYLLYFCVVFSVLGMAGHARLFLKRSISMEVSLLVVYTVFSILSFADSGKLSGGHWAESMSTLYQSSPTFVLIGNISNVLRVTMSMVIFSLVAKLGGSLPIFLGAMAGLVVFELVVSSNRIIFVFVVVTLCFVMRRSLGKFFIAGLCLAPALLVFNDIFPMVRGLIWSHGGVSSTAAVTSMAYSASTEHGVDYGAILASAVEGWNLTVMKYAMHDYVRDHGYLMGLTFFLKSFSFFVPRVFWPDRPDAFNQMLGVSILGVGIPLNSTVIGEGYGNFGYVACVILPVCFFAMHWAFKKVGGNDGLVSMMAYMIGLATWRFDFGFSVIGFAVISAIVVARLFVAGMFSHGSRQVQVPNEVEMRGY